MLHIHDIAWATRLTRRRWLQVGGIGLLGLTLPELLRAEQAARPAPRARSCVLFLLHGGPSQLDVWDMKPAAPVEVRGEFNPIATTVPGVQICEHLPLLAQQAHRFSIVRSMTHAAINHNAATYIVTTGQPPPREQIAFTPTENDFPHLGAGGVRPAQRRQRADGGVAARSGQRRSVYLSRAERRLSRSALRPLQHFRRSERRRFPCRGPSRLGDGPTRRPTAHAADRQRGAGAWVTTAASRNWASTSSALSAF